MNKIRIPIFNLSRQMKTIGPELLKITQNVFDQGVFVLGKNVLEFENEFANYTGSKYGVGVGSGTEALSLSLQALGVNPGDEVIMPANAYPTVFAITGIGAIPKPVDVDLDTHCMDPEKLAKALSKKTKAVIIVHMYGRPADIIAISKITRAMKVPLIEDCAHAHGLEIGIKNHELGIKNKSMKKAGTYGTVGCFSFYPTKNLGALGDGGMVVTDHEEIAEKLKLLRMYGEKKRYVSITLGRNSRLDELQAAYLRVKLRYLDAWNKKRATIASWYTAALSKCPIAVPSMGFNQSHVFHLYVIRSKNRDALKDYLETKGIGTGIHYPTPVSLIPSMKYLGYKPGDFPNSERASKEVLSLPMYPELEDYEVKFITNTIGNYFSNKR